MPDIPNNRELNGGSVQGDVQQIAREAVGDPETAGAGEPPPLSADQSAVSGLIRADRDARTGQFLKGNRGALTHGLYARVSDELQAERAEFEARSLADDRLTVRSTEQTRRRSLHAYRSRLHMQILALSETLEANGLFDKRGRLRVAWLTQLQALVSAALKVDATLGLPKSPTDDGSTLDAAGWLARQRSEPTPDEPCHDTDHLRKGTDHE